MTHPPGASPSTADLEAAAARLEQIAPGYLERIRGRAGELAVPKTPSDRARRSVDLVMRSARIDPNPPRSSRRRSGRVVKRVVGSLTRFYVAFLAEQAIDLGESSALMGSALCDYIDGLEAEVAALRDRVGRLERAQGSP